MLSNGVGIIAVALVSDGLRLLIDPFENIPLPPSPSDPDPNIPLILSIDIPLRCLCLDESDAADLMEPDTLLPIEVFSPSYEEGGIVSVLGGLVGVMDTIGGIGAMSMGTTDGEDAENFRGKLPLTLEAGGMGRGLTPFVPPATVTLVEACDESSGKYPVSVSVAAPVSSLSLDASTAACPSL